MKKQFLTINDLLKLFPTLKAYDLDYLVRNRIIPCVQRGKGYPRKFTSEAVKIIEARLKKIE